MLYSFENFCLDVDRQELRRGVGRIPVEPQVFDLLHFLIRNRDRVVSKDDMVAHVWSGRAISESTLSSRIAIARQAIDDSGDEQRLIRTIARKGVRFVGQVSESAVASTNASSATPGAAVKDNGLIAHPKILVVDDHVLIREALRGVLQTLKQGSTVLEASNAVQALQYAETDPDIELILLDLNLPDRNGFEVLVELRDRYPAISVVVLSATDARENVEKALNLGALGFIPKSVSREVMLSAFNLIFVGGIYVPPQILAPPMPTPRLVKKSRGRE